MEKQISTARFDSARPKLIVEKRHNIDYDAPQATSSKNYTEVYQHAPNFTSRAVVLYCLKP